MSDYIPGKKLLKRWKKSKHEFYYRFVKKGLMPFNKEGEYLTPSDVYANVEGLDPESVKGSNWNKIDLPGDEEEADKILEELQEAQFDSTHVKGLEKALNLKRKRKLDPRQKARLKCREIAKRLWEEEELQGDQSTSTTKMIEHEEILEASKRTDGKYYGEKTARKWIQDLNPAPQKGRPKKQKK